MPVDLKIARPFTLVGSDGLKYAYGIGLYPGVDDAIANMPFVQWHLQDAVLARGGWLAQQRWTTPAIGQLRLAFIWLRPEDPLVTIDIEAGWEPVYQDSGYIQFFPRLDVPQPDSLHIATDAAGVKGYRLTQRPDVFRNQPFQLSFDVIRVRPGDASPPVRGASPPLPRSVGDTRASPVAKVDTSHATLSRATAEAIAKQSAAMAIPPPATTPARTLEPLTAECVPATPRPATWDQQQYFDVDRRAAPVVKPPMQQPAPASSNIVLSYALYAERIRARLERRELQKWAA